MNKLILTVGLILCTNCTKSPKVGSCWLYRSKGGTAVAEVLQVGKFSSRCRVLGGEPSKGFACRNEFFTQPNAYELDCDIVKKEIKDNGR